MTRLWGRGLPRHRSIPLAVLVLVLLLTVAASALLNRFVLDQQQARFEREAGAYTFGLRDRLSDYENLLRATRSFWLVEGPQGPSPAQFTAYVGTLGLGGRYPGVQAVGFVRWTVGQGGAVATPITLISPLNASNRRALGFDMMTEPRRREAILRARERGAVQTTRPLDLVQTDDSGRPLPGLLLLLPVEQSGNLRGFVYLAVRTDQFLEGLLTSGGAGDLSVRPLLDGVPLRGAPPTPPGPVGFRDVSRLEVAGATWELRFAAPFSFGRDVAAGVPVGVLVAGLFVAGLAFLLTQAQVHARERAEVASRRLAQSQERLERSRAEFEAIFQAMQDAAAFTDPGGRIQLVNPALSRQFGHAPGALAGEPLARLHLDPRLEDRRTFHGVTTPYRRSDGSVFSGETGRSEVVGPGGEVLGLLEVVRDVTERLEAERALQAGERRYRGVLDAIPHMLWVSDPGGRVTYVNAQHRERLGADPVRARVHPGDLPAYARLWEEAQGGETRAQAEVRLELSGAGLSGAHRWFVLRVSPVRAAGGEVTEWVASATDIHDRVSAERLAQRNEERSRGVLEGLPQIVWLTDAGGQPTYFNRRWAEYVGPARAGDSFLTLLHPGDRAEYRARWAAAVRAGRPFEAEHRLLSQEGMYRTFVTRGLPVRDAGGGIIEWVGTSTDVDDQVHAEAAARLLADVSERLTARAEDPLAARSEPYRAALDRITLQLAESGALWGPAPMSRPLATSRVGQAWSAAGVQDALRGLTAEVAQGGEERLLRSHPLLHEVGASGAGLYPLTGRDGTVRGVLGLTFRQEPTERDHDLALELAKRFATALDNDALRAQAEAARADLEVLNLSLEERVRQRTLELQEANRELEAFSYSVSHDLRTPLRHIVGFGDLLRKEVGDDLSPKGERYLGVITDAAARMSRLIDDLLAFSRMGRQELRRGTVDLNAVLAEVWAGLEPDRAGREIITHFAPLPTVQGDGALLTQVFSNLLGNALKYSRTRERAEIEVGAQVQGHDLTVTVRDNGVGFDPRYTDKLFGVFQRLHRAEEFEGTGIGLANVRRIVTRHGGRVRAEGVPGSGAAFHVTLPLDAPAPAPELDRAP
ncbi:PAS domain S-box protein [Deinococcus aestuarii]|uniref:PAS domain S-box protein n=1 Tax=Deinococcus aestuarii TaxID=2774531 RepID=UPI001FEBEF1C|nr:PAS domain S-box protein [Deinococcus aestuarii]